jgi:hypothetical protein
LLDDRIAPNTLTTSAQKTHDADAMSRQTKGTCEMQRQTDAEISPNIACTSEGYLARRGVPVARTGTQIYGEHEVPGLRSDGNGMVSIVFSQNASGTRSRGHA